MLYSLQKIRKLGTEINSFWGNFIGSQQLRTTCPQGNKVEFGHEAKMALCLNPLLPGTMGLRLQETPATRSFLLVFNPYFCILNSATWTQIPYPALKKKKKNRKVNGENADLFISTFFRMGRQARSNAGSPPPPGPGFPGGGNYLITTFSNRPVSLLIKVS